MEFLIKSTKLDIPDEKITPTKLNDESFQDLNFWQMGTGSESIIADIQTGFYLGGEDFLTAPFSVSMLGKVKATNYELTGGTISGAIISDFAQGSALNIQGWTSTLGFQSTDYRTVTWTSGVITLADGTAFSIGTGNTGNMAALTYIYFDKAVSTTALQITTTAATAVGVNKILIAVAQNNSDITKKATYQVFGGKGGVSPLITADNIAANAITANEIATNTITANQLSTALLYAGSFTLDTAGAIKSGKTGYTDDTNAGFWLGDVGGVKKLNIGSSATKYLHYNGTDFSMLGGTITGGIIQTGGATGTNTRLNGSNNTLEFLYNNAVKGYIYADSDGQMLIDADNSIYITADGSGDSIGMWSGTGGTVIDSDGNIALTANDAVGLEFNDGGGSNNLLIINDGSTHTSFRDNGDCRLEGRSATMYFHRYETFDYAEYFESTTEFSKEKIVTGTSVILDNGLVRPAKKGEIPFGIVSKSSFIVSGGAGNPEWKGKYIRDEYGVIIMEKAERWYLKQKNNKTLKGWADEETPPIGSKIIIKERPKISPNYNNNLKYIPREDRPEWNNIGLLGRIPMISGQPTNPSWVKIRNISENIEEWLVK